MPETSNGTINFSRLDEQANHLLDPGKEVIIYLGMCDSSDLKSKCLVLSNQSTSPTSTYINSTIDLIRFYPMISFGMYSSEKPAEAKCSITFIHNGPSTELEDNRPFYITNNDDSWSHSTGENPQNGSLEITYSEGKLNILNTSDSPIHIFLASNPITLEELAKPEPPTS